MNTASENKSGLSIGKAPLKADTQSMSKTFNNTAATNGAKKMNTKAEAINTIAIAHLELTTLSTRNSDRLDFSDQAVWSIAKALRAAYEAGRRSTQGTTNEGTK